MPWTNTSSSDSEASSNAIASDTKIDPVAAKTVAEILGEIVWLMTQDASARKLPLREVERQVMPAILLRLFHIQYMKVHGQSGLGGKPQLQCVRAELWAMCSKTVAARLDANPSATLTLADWQSGTERRTLASFTLFEKGGVQ